MMPRSRSSWRIDLLKYALSARTRSGVVRGLPPHDGQGQASAVDDEVDLGGQPPSGSPEGLARLRAARTLRFVPLCGPFLLTPAACWWARLTVESTETVHSTRPIASSRIWTHSGSLAQVPPA